MRFAQILGTVALAGLVSAHSEAGSIPGAPKVFGRKSVRDLKARGLLREAARSAPEPKRHLAERQVGGTNGRCGPGVGSCAAGYCCSAAGYCGNTEDYCEGPDCQYNYGTGCDFWTVPAGTSTSGVARPQVGNVPYGGNGIYDCVEPNMIALTFDDGPYIYTQQVLNVLNQYNVKATFFITGNNLGKGEIDNAAFPWTNIIKSMYNAGHQVASHTWTHQDLGSQAPSQGQETLTRQQRLNQMYYNEMAFRNILGVFPTYMRPPYSDCDAPSGCESDLAGLGYHITYFDLDTEDYLNDSPTMIQTSKNDFRGNISSVNAQTGNWLVIGHDIHQQTAYNLTEYMITTGMSMGYKFGTVGDCLGDPKANWYRSASGGVLVSTSTGAGHATGTGTAPTGTATVVSTDGTCGGAKGYTCQGSTFGNCCSPAGWCGSTTAYCGTGCQAGFGSCGSNNPPTTSKTSTTTTTSKTTTSTGGTPTGKVSTDGTCGGTKGFTCAGSTFGTCCSSAGWCGTTTAYCGTGCQAAFGTCGTGGGTTPPPTTKVSTDGSCGGTKGYTCTGSTFGNCCSKNGWCGSTTAYCGTGCQAAFGTC